MAKSKRVYRFLNPYNFIRSLSVKSPTAAALLGRCMPPPHDRYVGLTGRMTCRLTAVTPLFISDSHGVFERPQEAKDHFHYRFFRDPNGHPAIPATSLRGTIRSVFEATTNSCFSVFAGHKRLSYHLPPGEALKLVPARVHQLSDQAWELELLTGTTPLAIGQRPRGPQYAAWIHVYNPLRPSQAAGKVPNHPYSKRKKLSLSGWHHRQECWAVIEPMKHPLRRFEFWNVVALADRPDKLKAGQGQRLVHGYLCITHQNIENKHDERLFFRTDDNNVGSRRVELPEPIRLRYNELIADYQERHADDIRRREQSHKEDPKVPPPDQPRGKEPAFSRFIVKEAATKLADDDLAYAMLEQAGRSVRVKFIVPVSVPRVGYEKAVVDLLPQDLLKCRNYKELCPTCRVFGWVWGTGAPDEAPPPAREVTAYRGRVRFSHASLIQNAGTFNATLAILSTPKPTTNRFYLMPSDGKLQDGLEDEAVSYDSPSQVLRGRKFYRHHGNQLSETEYRSPNSQTGGQNRTVHDVQQAGSVFEFTVEFENLASVELGAVLWVLEMEGWHHRLGLGKPLGFGSVIIQVVSLKFLDPIARYSTLANGWQDGLGQKPALVTAFKQAMKARYSQEFEQLANIRDLRALLAEPLPLPVHYPRATQQPHPEGRNYEWFMGNKRSGRDAGPRRVLRLAAGDQEGLPLIDRFGRIQE